jgi:putative hydrolase
MAARAPRRVTICRVIDWSIAQRIGELVAGSPPFGGVSDAQLAPLAQDFAERVSAYSQLRMPDALPPLEIVDRPRWIAANLRSMRPMIDPLTERISADAAAPGGSFGAQLSRIGDKLGGLGGANNPFGGLGGPLGGLGEKLPLALAPLTDGMRSAGGLLLGAQVGAITGVLSQRVLGQYDLALLDDSVAPRLLLVAPNLNAAANSLRVDRSELVSWVTIHEITHAVQFSGAPWLRAHLGGLLQELIAGMEVALTPGSLFKRPDGVGDLRELVERLRRGELLRVTLGDERYQLVEQLQSAMSLVEGHAEHVMDAVGADVLPSLPRLRAAMTRRRSSRPLLWRVLERLMGLEMKMRQYTVGREFCDAVVAADGPARLARAWESPESLPTAEELESPQRWLARTHVPPVTKS